MSYDRDNDLQRALERLTIQDVWRRAGLPEAPRDGNVVVKSPFRDDKKGKAFSIFKRGAVAKDQGTGEVFSVFKFAERAVGLSGRELVDRLCEWANVTRTVHVRKQLRDAMSSAAAGAPVELPPEVKRLARRLERQDQQREAEDRLYGQLLTAKAPKTEVRELHPWSDVVRARYLDGWREMKGNSERLKDWAHDRAWPVEWVSWLHDRGLISAPLVPWAVAGTPGAQRGKAFAVDLPIFADDGAFLEMRRIGYHQRYFMLGERQPDGSRAPSAKLWTYVPYMPSEEKQGNEFQREMVRIELARGGEIGCSRMAGLPFAIGDFFAPRFLCVTEGQWDAVTFAGACGWFGIDPSEWGAAVLGVRGNEGADTMLAYWRPWLRLHRPAVLVLADNDAAGKKWDHVEPKELGKPVPPSLAEKFKAAGARRVYVSRVRPEIGKDFNDYWKVRQPSADQMAAWLQRLGFFDSAGAWA
jgi:hypothetical protein